jgi:uncharacterized coiled-coil protein SlyX
MTEAERISSVENSLQYLSEIVANTSKSVNQLSQEMREFKDEMLKFREESEQDRKDMNKKWGELANKMGTVVEDLIFPNISYALMTAFNEEDQFVITRHKRRNKEKNIIMELDLVAITENNHYIVETKTTVTKEKVDEFERKIQSDNFSILYPELTSKAISLIVASLSIEKEMQEYILAKGMYPMVLKDNLMVIITE